MDLSGRGVALTPASAATGVALGPALGALSVSSGDYSGVVWLTVTASLASFVCFWLSGTRRARAPPTA